MFAQIKYPEKLLPEELDDYLQQGWFRMRQTIFTTNFLHFNNQFYSAIWLRVALSSTATDKKQRTLQKLNKRFRTEFNKAAIGSVTVQHESLYQSYRRSLSFDVSVSLKELLFGNELLNRFNTYEANIYDGDTLIAAGFFDLGKNSAAGISCIYHPFYKKFSLGKYLMYLKMDFCRQHQLQYFYPGYVVPGYAPFDYKLEIGKGSLQYLHLASTRWLPFTSFTPGHNPLQDMLGRLKNLLAHFENSDVPVSLLYYKFFEANLDPYYFGQGLLDFPVFLYRFQAIETSLFNLIVFDVRDGMYHLLQCSSVINIGFQHNSSKIFDSDLLRMERTLLVTANSGELLGKYLEL